MNDRCRSWRALLAGGALVLLGACGGPPPGVDGELVDQWAPLPAPVGFIPEAWVCHEAEFSPVAPLVEYDPLPCDQPHLTETVYVGAFTGDAPDLAEPPAPGSVPHRWAYRECEERVAEHLGADFRHGRLWLGVAVPSEPGWEGGGRWFRCDLMEIDSVYGGPVVRESALAGGLAGETGEVGLRLGCFRVSVTDDEVTKLIPVPCGRPHEAEFVGTWSAPDGPWPDLTDRGTADRVYQGCRERVAEYVDVPVDGDLVYRTGAIADWLSESAWRLGDRAFRCYLWLPGQELTGSLVGAGPDALPIRTG